MTDILLMDKNCPENVNREALKCSTKNMFLILPTAENQPKIEGKVTIDCKMRVYQYHISQGLTFFKP